MIHWLDALDHEQATLGHVTADDPRKLACWSEINKFLVLHALTVFLMCEYYANFRVELTDMSFWQLAALSMLMLDKWDVGFCWRRTRLRLSKLWLLAISHVTPPASRSGVQFRHGQRFRIGTHLLSRNAADLVPGQMYVNHRTMKSTAVDRNKTFCWLKDRLMGVFWK